MANVLADLAVESEAATAAALRLARAYDAGGSDHGEALLARVVTPVVKYWTCKRAPQHAAEALECLGGNGFVEESDLPRLFRQSPVNGVWEGSGNVICLDVLRALARAPEVLEAYWAEVELAAGTDRHLDEAANRLRKELADLDSAETRGRRLVELLAVVFCGSLLIRHAPAAVSDAYTASRLAADGGRAFGTLPPGVDTRAIIERARPRPS
jgi:putative acyl-CoA dehydrogenase